MSTPRDPAASYPERPVTDPGDTRAVPATERTDVPPAVDRNAYGVDDRRQVVDRNADGVAAAVVTTVVTERFEISRSSVAPSAIAAPTRAPVCTRPTTCRSA